MLTTQQLEDLAVEKYVEASGWQEIAGLYRKRGKPRDGATAQAFEDFADIVADKAAELCYDALLVESDH